MHAHLKAGWTYSAYTGAIGGWEFDNGSGMIAVACKETARARTWQAFVIRRIDGSTLFHSEYRTRNDAMMAAVAALNADTTARAAASLSLPSVLAIVGA